METRTSFKWALPLVLLTLAAVKAHLLWGQDVWLKIAHLEKLEAKADNVVDVSLDGSMLQLASKFLSNSKPDEAKVKDLISGLKGVYVRSFEFNVDNAYSNEDVDAIRSQLQGPGWVRMVGIRSRRDKENVEVFMLNAGQKINGLAILCSKPKELTVVNIVGLIDLDKLSELEGQFGIPKLGLEAAEKSKKDKGKE